MTTDIASAAAAIFDNSDFGAPSVFSTLLSSSATPQISDSFSNYNFIETLALAQRLRVPFLPITWRSALGAIIGGQAEIYQSLINAHKSLAFKLFRSHQRRKESKLQELINEIVVLAHPMIQRHPHVVRLEGICWDIPQDEHISPVLVFEKAQTGDLHRFLRSGQGEQLSTMDRLNICVDIGVAVRDMHYNGILHGDLKPENVLMFSGTNNSLLSKVADFGCSTRSCGESDLNIQNSTPRPGFRDILAERSNDDDFSKISAECLDKDESLSIDLKLRLSEFFTLTLVGDPGKRSSGFDLLLHRLMLERELPKPQVVELEPIPEQETFKLESSFHDLYLADFRLRAFIVQELEAMAASPVRAPQRIHPRNLCLQIALCYWLGFGITKDFRMAKTYLDKHNIPESQLHDCVALIRDATLPTNLQTGVVSQLINDGYITLAERAQQYRNDNILDSAVETCQREITSLEESLTHEHPLVLTLKLIQVQMLKDAGHVEQAEILGLQAVEVSKRIGGSTDLSTLNAMISLSSIYQDQGQLEKAEALKVEVVELLKSIGTNECPWSLLAQANLAATYRSQGRWEEAEGLEVEVLEKRTRLLGEIHIDTLTSMANLAHTYSLRGRWGEAKSLEMRVITGAESLLGTDHPLTLIWMANLASTYHELGQLKDALDLRDRMSKGIVTVLGPCHPKALSFLGETARILRNIGHWEKAETLLLTVLKRKREALGADHASALTSTSNLASIYQSQGRYKESEELELDVVERSSRTLGKDHPDTLVTMGNLASNYRKQNRLKEAEELQHDVLQIQIENLGEDHLDTVWSMSSLGSILLCQGRYEEARELLLKVFASRKKFLGPSHPSTLITAGNLALAYLRQGFLNEAEELEKMVLENRIKVLGEGHPDTKTSMDNLATILDKRRNSGAAAAAATTPE